MDEFEKWSLTSTEALTLRGAWEAGREAGMREASEIAKAGQENDWTMPIDAAILSAIDK